MREKYYQTVLHWQTVRIRSDFPLVLVNGLRRERKEREGIIPLPTPRRRRFGAFTTDARLFDCFENWGHGGMRQRNHPRKILCQFIEAVRRLNTA